jgi:hypothetical protein
VSVGCMCVCEYVGGGCMGEWREWDNRRRWLAQGGAPFDLVAQGLVLIRCVLTLLPRVVDHPVRRPLLVLQGAQRVLELLWTHQGYIISSRS